MTNAYFIALKGLIAMSLFKNMSNYMWNNVPNAILCNVIL